MQGDLAVQTLGKEARVTPVNRDPGIISRGFYAEH
jgi:hypothetical protein